VLKIGQLTDMNVAHLLLTLSDRWLRALSYHNTTVLISVKFAKYRVGKKNENLFSDLSHICLRPTWMFRITGSTDMNVAHLLVILSDYGACSIHCSISPIKHRFAFKMFTGTDKAMIEGLYHAKGWGARRIRSPRALATILTRPQSM
jgi:hypothetical protein